MRAEGENRENEKEEKRKGKRRKHGDQNRFFFFFFIFFIYNNKSVRMFFSYAQWSFFKYIKKTLSRLSRSYPLLFAIKILMVSQFGDL